MGRRKRHRRYRSRPRRMNEGERLQWIFVLIVFIVLFVFYSIWGFTSNCIIEWPIRWDVVTCWGEQVSPAKEKALEKAVQFAL